MSQQEARPCPLCRNTPRWSGEKYVCMDKFCPMYSHYYEAKHWVKLPRYTAGDLQREREEGVRLMQDLAIREVDKWFGNSAFDSIAKAIRELNPAVVAAQKEVKS